MTRWNYRGHWVDIWDVGIASGVLGGWLCSFAFRHVNKGTGMDWGVHSYGYGFGCYAKGWID